MIASERERLILAHLQQHQIATTDTLTHLTGASVATVRRDLKSMAARGLLQKTHGGATDITAAGQGRQACLSEDDPHLPEKDRLARTAAKLVKPGDTIFLGAGKTCTLLARYIRDIENIRVVTTNINSIIELAASDKASMLLLGGDINVGSNYIETLDEYTLQSLNKFYFDRVFITVNGVDFDFGYSINFRLQIMLYEYLQQNSKDFYVMVDKHKFGQRAFTQFRGLAEVPQIVTSPDTDPAYLRFYEEHGVKVYT